VAGSFYALFVVESAKEIILVNETDAKPQLRRMYDKGAGYGVRKWFVNLIISSSRIESRRSLLQKESIDK
jgi:hypothetical protein